MSLRDLSRKMDDFVSVKAVQLMGGGAPGFIRLGKRYEELGWAEEALDAYQARGRRRSQPCLKLCVAR